MNSDLEREWRLVELERLRVRQTEEAFTAEAKELAGQNVVLRAQLSAANKQLAMAMSLVMALDLQPDGSLHSEVVEALAEWKRRGY